MTAATSQKLADALYQAGLIELAERAKTDEFHDFLSSHALPDLVLDGELAIIAKDPKRDNRQRLAAHYIRLRHHKGEFDASLQESDAWADSPDGKEAFGQLLKEHDHE